MLWHPEMKRYENQNVIAICTLITYEAYSSGVSERRPDPWTSSDHRVCSIACYQVNHGGNSRLGDYIGNSECKNSYWQ